MRYFTILLSLLTTILGALTCFGQSELNRSTPLEFIQHKDPLVDTVLSNPERFHFQWIFTPLLIDSSGNFQPKKTYDYSTGHYFYPASMVKLPTALLTLEKLQEQAVSRSAQLKIHSDQICGNMAFAENTQKQAISFETMIEEMISISDNGYYTSLYHFLSPAFINDRLTEKGISDTKIYKGFNGCEFPENLNCNSLEYFDSIANKTYQQSATRMELSDMACRYTYSTDKLFGAQHEYRGKIVGGPFDFNYSLEYPLYDIHGSMERLIYPEQFATNERWNLSHTDREFLLKSLALYPREMKNSAYHDLKKYPDNYYKYLVLGDGNPQFVNVKTFSKIGISYGFVTETALVVDEENGKAYLLSASIYVNSNNTVNDGKYEYEQIARPFFAKLGQILLQY